MNHYSVTGKDAESMNVAASIRAQSEKPPKNTTNFA